MKLTKKPERKTLYLAAAALIGILLAVGASFAAYTNQAHLRGTVRNQDGQSVRFTSNYMQSCAYDSSSYAGKTVLFDESAKTADSELRIDITVCNYINGNRDLVSEKDIEYVMTIKLTDGESGDYTVGDDNGTSATVGADGTYTFKARTLTGRTANTHTYKVTFRGSDIDKLKITATAVPTNSSVTDNQKLAAVIAPCTASRTNEFSCTGSFTDSTSGNNPADYDALNYEVTVSSGRAEVTLSWNADAVEIDPFFLTKLENRGNDYNIGASPYTKTEHSLTFIMDQTTGTGDYVIPFYIVDRSQVKDLTWDQMVEKKIVSVTGEEIKQTTTE